MRKIKEMSEIDSSSGYEKQSTSEMSKQAYNQNEKRNKLIGEVDMFEPYCEEIPTMGFVARGNVRERN